MTDLCMLLYSQGIRIGGVLPQLGLDAEQWAKLFESCFFNMCIHVVLAENPSGLCQHQRSKCSKVVSRIFILF